MPAVREDDRHLAAWLSRDMAGGQYVTVRTDDNSATGGTTDADRDRASQDFPDDLLDLRLDGQEVFPIMRDQRIHGRRLTVFLGWTPLFGGCAGDGDTARPNITRSHAKRNSRRWRRNCRYNAITAAPQKSLSQVEISRSIIR